MQINGTTYDDRTPLRVAQELERLRGTDTRIRVCYGDVETGQDWGETYDTTGRVGRSMGPVKVPLLIHNRRSIGGASILDRCIVRISFANKRDGGDLYRHPSYMEPTDA